MAAEWAERWAEWMVATSGCSWVALTVILTAAWLDRKKAGHWDEQRAGSLAACWEQQWDALMAAQRDMQTVLMLAESSAEMWEWYWVVWMVESSAEKTVGGRVARLAAWMGEMKVVVLVAC